MEQLNIGSPAGVLDEAEEITVSGRLIGATNDAESIGVDESYPLRLHLRYLSRSIWSDLLNSQRRPRDIWHAVDVVRQEFESCFAALEAEAVEDEEPVFLCSQSAVNEFLLDDHLESRQESRRRTMPNGADPNCPPLMAWYVQTDPAAGLEAVGEQWLNQKGLWQVEPDWTWADIYDFLALLAIDSTVLHIERVEPFKAAVAVARASEYHGMATAIRWSEKAEEATISSLGRRGADARHGPNREAREEAIRLYLSKDWPSLAQAARSIAAQVHRTERVVEKWVREHRRTTSAGKVPT